MQDQFANGRKLRTLDVFHEDYAGALSLQANVICMAQNTSVVCLKHGLRHAAFRSNNPARQAVTECVYRPLQSYGTPRTVGSEHL